MSAADPAAAGSGDDDDLDADCVVGAACPGVSGSQGHAVLLGGKGHESVIDGAARDSEAAEGVRQRAGAAAAEDERRGEAGFEQAGGVGGGKPGGAWQPGQDRIGLGQGMAAERELLPVPPAGNCRVVMVGPDEQGDRDTGVNSGRHLRPASMRAKMTSSSTGVSPAAMSTPSSSTSCAVRPAGTSCAPAP